MGQQAILIIVGDANQDSENSSDKDPPTVFVIRHESSVPGFGGLFSDYQSVPGPCHSRKCHMLFYRLVSNVLHEEVGGGER